MISEIVVNICKTTTRERIKDMTVPFVLLYDELVKAKEILPLGKLPEQEKRNYWNETEGDKFNRVIQCRALYIYDVITKP